MGYLSLENIHGKSIEAAYNSLLNVQSDIVEGPHGGEQESWSPRTEHVDVHSPSFPQPHFHLEGTKKSRMTRKIMINPPQGIHTIQE